MGQTASCMTSVQVLTYGSDLGSSALSNRPNGFQECASLDELKRTIRVPLTEREVFAITKSWKTISSNMTHTGIAMFLRMFEARSDVMGMFEQFRSVDKADLGSNRSLENHALLVMNALDEAIANMDDPEYLIDMLLTTGKSHQRFENFSTTIFWAIEEPFIVAVREALLDRFTPGVEHIYRKTIKFILSTLTAGFRFKDRDTADIDSDLVNDGAHLESSATIPQTSMRKSSVPSSSTEKHMLSARNGNIPDY